MKTLHFISLNSYFVGIHVIVRFTRNYCDFVGDNDCAIFIKIPGLFKRQRQKNVFLTLHVLKNRCFIDSFKLTRKYLQLSTNDKKQFIVTKRLHLATTRLSKDQRNQTIGVLNAGSTVNDIAHHFGCSRQTVHNLMNLYNSSGSVRVRARPGRARVTTLRHYHVNTFSHLRSRFNQQPLLLGIYGVHAQQNSESDIFQHNNARPHTTRKYPHKVMLKITSTSCIGLLNPQS